MHAPTRPKQKPSWRRRLVFSGIAVILVAALLEVVSAVIYLSLTGERFSYDRVEEAQESLTGELAAKVTEPGSGSAERKKEELMRLIRMPHPYLGFVYSRELNKVKNPNFEQRFPINSFGFIDEHPPIRKRSPDTVLVGVLGGSVALLFYRGGEEALVEQLQAFPQFRDKKISFVRLALGGVKQPQQLLTLTYLLSLGAEFDIVINIDGFNEVTLPPPENVQRGIYPFFPRSWDIISSQIREPGFQFLVGKDVYLRDERASWAQTFLDLPTKYSATLQLIWAIRDHSLAVDQSVNQAEMLAYDPQKPTFLATGPGTEGFTVANLPGLLAEHWATCSLHMSRLCRDHEILYLHFLQPNQYVKGSKPMGSVERSRAVNDQHPFKVWAELGYPELIQKGKELREHGVDFHDLTMAFSEIQEQIYVDDCCHFNERGNRIMADLIAGAILDACDREMARGLFGMDPDQIGPVMAFGRGVAGTGGTAPILDTGDQKPDIGNQDFVLRIRQGVGGAAGTLLVSDRPKDRHSVRRGLCVPLQSTGISLRTSGRPGQARAGLATVRVPIPNDPALRGITVYCQAFLRDQDARGGWSSSNGLRIAVQ